MTKPTTRRQLGRAPTQRVQHDDQPHARIAQLEAELAAARERSIALEQANLELRNLTQSLHQVVRQRTRALAESEAQLRRKNIELDRLSRMKSEFVSIAAHELRTPMTSIVGYLDLIALGRMGELPDDLRRPVASLRRNAHRLKRLVDDMLDASRIESGRMVLRRAPCSLGEIVVAVVEEMRPLAEQRGQSIVLAVEPIPFVDADADKLHQVVSNLLANSSKYSKEGGLIRVTVDTELQERVECSSARLRVWDNGIGIPLELRGRIFEPFFDVQTAKHHTSAGPDSAGLGLYLARGIIELHGGTIELDSEEGAYSEFCVLLPLAAADQKPQVATSSLSSLA